MIGIKKVQVTSLENYGKIIDSASTTDDKATNTYSMRIIDNKISDLTSNVYVKGDYAELTGTITMTDGEGTITDIAYPTGFTQSNCYVLSCMLNLSTNPSGTYSEGIIPDSTGLSTGAVYRRVSLLSSAIGLGIKNYTASGSGTFNYKILLLKVS